MKIQSLATLPFTQLAKGQPQVKKNGKSLSITLGAYLITLEEEDIAKLTQVLAPPEGTTTE